MRASFKRLLACRAGNFGVLTALLAVPLLGCIGMALDFTRALDERNLLMTAADAAAIGALSEQSAGVIAALSAGGNGDVTIAEEDARHLFNAQLEAAGIEISSLDISVTKTGSDLKSTVSFSAKVPTSFLRVIDKNEITVSGTANAVFKGGGFIDFYVLLDNTPSMGVGATEADIAMMEKNTSDTCAFACHDLSKSNNYYNLAKKLGVQMRIDVVRQATQKLTQTAADSMRYTNQFRMAVYTFGASATDAKLTNVAGLSSDMKSVSSAASAIDLMTIPRQNYNDDQTTDLDAALKQLKDIIQKGGSGQNKSDPEKVVFFVSDGLTDSAKGSACTKKTTNGTRCQEPIDYSFCTTLKDKGIKIAVLYTTYLPLPKNDWYKNWIKPFQSEIATHMQSCASPGLYFEVSPSEGIADAMNALFKKVISSPRLAS